MKSRAQSLDFIAMPASQNLRKVINLLARFYGKPKPPISTNPFELILWENVAYLVSDERRAQAFALLRTRVGTKPHEILAASNETLLQVATLGGVQPERRAARLRELALIAMNEFDGDPASALKLPLAKAKKALQQFPGIGEPGAEKKAACVISAQTARSADRLETSAG